MLIPAMPVGATLAAERLAAGWVATGVLVILMLHLELIEIDRRYKDNVKGGSMLHILRQATGGNRRSVRPDAKKLCLGGTRGKGGSVCNSTSSSQSYDLIVFFIRSARPVLLFISD